MNVFVVTYFYPDGSCAGIFGVWQEQASANAAVTLARMTDYPDCIFVVTEAGVQ